LTPPRYVLGSRSPRRRELLSLLAPAEQIEIVPPASADEPGFERLTDWPAIRAQLQRIARGKADQVRSQLGRRAESVTIITADTTIVCGNTSAKPQAPGDIENCLAPPLTVLGQPPEDDTWRDVVRDWFQQRYAGRTHLAATAVCVVTPDGMHRERVVTTAVTMRADVGPWLDWYLATDEPRGKAGGYALQGAASVFITGVDGSLSNVVGLPLEALAELLGVPQEAEG
jgi:septum formation protein